jgi:hypothetical protein
MDGIEPRLLLDDHVVVLLGESLEGRPSLSIQTNELAGILANWTLKGWLGRGRKLRAAGETNKGCAHSEEG